MEKFKAFFTKEKIHAFLIHLGLSLIIFAGLLYFILVEWYPQPLFRTDGGWQGIRLIAFVDIVLGPLLTLVVYKQGKAKLKLDLFIIAIIQFSALISGTIVVYGEHPVAIVIMDNRLNPITADQVREAGITIASLKNYSDLHPPMIFVNLPQDPDKLLKLRTKTMAEGKDLRLNGNLYEKLTQENKQKLIRDAMSVDAFLENKKMGPKKDKAVAIYQKFLEENKFKDRSLIFFPLYSRYEFGIAVLDKATFEMLDILDIFPPQVGDVIQKLN
ncbi:hypothetical protein MNBD_GAMMA22-1432 [hydrothermal vent metagenome]|uniref:FimB n=1 Tax=hydrothermal vent metagenome TaxID=652676 RepID=A0A3B1A029_9ZZZZ